MNATNNALEYQKVWPVFDPRQLANAATEYATDAWQRAVLYADVRRQRGNQYREHLSEAIPNVLDFPAELVMSGLDLPRPVNYGLVRIIPSAKQSIDPAKRPFIVVDPRAGQSPGIGGFKRDSEVGDALAAGHPCYFVGFLPDPVPGQTVEDVMRAEAAFVRKVGELHPDSPGKPAVIGNCQAGWQIMMAAAVWPDLFGPIILAGAPLSYWAGHNPMRYSGGLAGGSWLTALTSDLGNGRFDGAWLVQNFENLNPANTLWTKQYNLYSKVDTEAERYLDFEKFWGGYVFLNDIEMQFTVDELFVGNKLATAELVTSDGVRIDLRNIRSPILVFCSYGDNITPPPQALGWITDLYRDDRDLVSHDQTIVYATHDRIGHLGIFVSGKVGRKEHRKFTNNIELIDMLPAGLFQAEVEDVPPDAMDDGLVRDPFLLTIRPRTVDDVREIVAPDAASEKRFAAVERTSEINLALYRNLVQPWVRAMTSPLSARWLQALNPMRVGYEHWSDGNPMAPVVARLAQSVRERRAPVAPDNPFLLAQQSVSHAIVECLDTWRDQRDRAFRIAFETIYGSPWVQALAGQATRDSTPPRPHPGDSPEHCAFIDRANAEARAAIARGGLAEAEVRALASVILVRGEVDEHLFREAVDLVRQEYGNDYPQADVRTLVRAQLLLMRMDPEAAIAALPTLLATVPAERVDKAAAAIRDVVMGEGELPGAVRERLDEVLAMFNAARRVAAGKRTGDRDDGRSDDSAPRRVQTRRAQRASAAARARTRPASRTSTTKTAKRGTRKPKPRRS